MNINIGPFNEFTKQSSSPQKTVNSATDYNADNTITNSNNDINWLTNTRCS